MWSTQCLSFLLWCWASVSLAACAMSCDDWRETIVEQGVIVTALSFSLGNAYGPGRSLKLISHLYIKGRRKSWRIKITYFQCPYFIRTAMHLCVKNSTPKHNPYTRLDSIYAPVIKVKPHKQPSSASGPTDKSQTIRTGRRQTGRRRACFGPRRPSTSWPRGASRSRGSSRGARFRGRRN